MRPASIATIAFVSLAAGLTAFFMVRANTNSETVLADPIQIASTTPSGTNTTQARGGPTPPPPATAEGLIGLPAEPTDFPVGWSVPYYEAYAQLSRYTREVNGIHVGPDVVPGNGRCEPGAAEYVDPDTVRDSDIWFEPFYLPSDALVAGEPRVAEITAVACAGEPVNLKVTYAREAAPDVEERLAAGESWFDIPTGGLITIFRSSARGPMARSSIAAERWYATTIGGLPAAVGRPILDRGLGDGAVIIWDAERGITTHIFVLNLGLEEMLKVAGGVR